MSKKAKKPKPLRSGSNRFATMSKQKAKRKGDTTRRRLDDYETPEEVTNALVPFFRFTGKDLLEPCAGSGRIVRALKKLIPGLRVTTADIKRGQNFLKRTTRFKGDCITNPPYNKGQAEAFARHALKLCDGRVAMLMQTGWLTGDKRTRGMFLAGLRPECVVMISWRILFVKGNGKRIDSQFFNHCWVIWPPRSKRGTNKTTAIEFVLPPAEFNV